MSFSSINYAIVHLLLPKREMFTNNSSAKPKASVVLNVKEGCNLTKKDISAMSHIASSSVENLSPDEVTLVSTDGKYFKHPSSDNIHGNTSLEYKN